MVRTAEPRIELGETAENTPLLRTIFASSRAADFEAIEDAATRALIVDLQFSAQASHYRAQYPQAQDRLILVDGVPVGRLLTWVGADALRLVDIAILPEHRLHGTGTRVLNELCARADSLELPIELSVWAANTDAARLYQRLGFRQDSAAGGYLGMRRPVGGSAR